MASGVKISKMNFELNPRGNLWFNDESTFGHKLLSKMGWSKGKGLGKNEDGIKENIKISKKESNTGVGWKHGEIPVAVGCLEYENILQNLQKRFNNNKCSTSESFEKSLEQRSRTARNHLHYQKFVRGKDLIRYSEKDMKSIFLEKPQKPVSEHPSHLPQEGQTFNSRLSVNDYFALKMQKKKEEAAKSESNVTTENSVSSQLQPIDEKPSKKRKFVPESPEREITKKAKLKKMKSNRHETSSSREEDSVAEKSSESDKTNKSKKKKKKSKRKKSRLQELKSCLKSRTAYDLEETRNVSFNEQVSYKILDTSLELCEEINDLAADNATADEATCEDERSPTLSDSDEVPENEMPHSQNGDCIAECEEGGFLDEEDSFTNKEGGFTNEEEEESGAEEEGDPPCFDLPKCSGSNFNFWLESQRQAAKMELYKEMVKKIRKNTILNSTNLLDIKGYGNWGS